MKPKQNSLFLFICLVIMVSSCRNITIRGDHPVFVNQAQAEDELIGLVEAENISLNGTESNSSAGISTELEIAVINGKDIPERFDQQKDLQKSIARTILRNLQDPNQFESYKVSLVKKTEIFLLTTENSTGHTFKVSEL